MTRSNVPQDKGFELVFGSPPERRRLVGEVRFNGVILGTILQEHAEGEFELEIGDGSRVEHLPVVPASEFVRVIQDAIDQMRVRPCA